MPDRGHQPPVGTRGPHCKGTPTHNILNARPRIWVPGADSFFSTIFDLGNARSGANATNGCDVSGLAAVDDIHRLSYRAKAGGTAENPRGDRPCLAMAPAAATGTLPEATRSFGAVP
jgi:hypothetical protein